MNDEDEDDLLDQSFREFISEVLEDMRDMSTTEREYRLCVGTEEYTMQIDINASLLNSDIADILGEEKPFDINLHIGDKRTRH